ncbi:MAG: uroporphyrinogen-III C-methyltransferase [Deltaproteobacteria bacterium]|nr:uroporphyrinogen-III C-methyltransferase [Deltaproteobacteria bacterium]
MTGRGFVYLVGAGPGDPKLLTLRALEILQSADVVAHDELVSEAILACVPAAVELLPVGRRHGSRKASYRLHPSVLERARAGAVVARLKSGDPLIFGRGGEEAEELAEAGIPYEIVPGVSAALGAAAYAGIPLTHRLYASRVTFVTGHHAEGSPGSDGETIVLFMAAHRLEANLERLIASGRASSTPVAYVAAATTPEQKVIVGTLADLSGRITAIDRSLPALVIVGEAVNVRRRIA